MKNTTSVNNIAKPVIVENKKFASLKKAAAYIVDTQVKCANNEQRVRAIDAAKKRIKTAIKNNKEGYAWIAVKHGSKAVEIKGQYFESVTAAAVAMNHKEQATPQEMFNMIKNSMRYIAKSAQQGKNDIKYVA